MPSRIIHYCAANQILKKVNYNRELFILGNLAPDANKSGTKEMSHFKIPREQRVNDYLDINSFITKYMKGDCNEMTMGYYCHLITDNIWLTEIYRKYVKSESKEENAKRI